MDSKKDPQVDAEGSDEEAAEKSGKPLSQAQKKKLKAKQKAEEEKKLAATAGGGGDDDEDDKPAAGKAKKGKKGGPPAGTRNAIAEAIKEKQRLQKLEEDRIKAEEDLIRQKEEEEERIRKAEEEIKKAQDEIRKKEKLEKIQLLKDQGLYMNKKQREQFEEAKRKREQLIAMGFIKPDEEEDDGAADNDKKSSMVKRDRKKKKAQPTPQEAAVQDGEHLEAAKEVKTASGADSKKTATGPYTAEVPAAEEEEDVIEDWENEDIDVMAKKIASKDILPATAGGKIIHLDEEDRDDDDLDTTVSSLQSKKDQNKLKSLAKANKKEEEEKGGDVFGQAAEQQGLTKEQRLEERKKRQEERKKDVIKNQQLKKIGNVKLRCPILCILGHVDTGKTLILDKLRRTNVQAGEAGGITQQIGATYFPESAIVEHMVRMKGRLDFDLQIPGFQVIDTPGHESFTNLRSRGSSLCDFAILVVDIMHGLEKQTLESLQLLKNKKTPFVVALNKIDRIYQWKTKPFNNVRDSLEAQDASAKHEFRERLNKAILAFAEEGINAALYWENDDPQSYVSLIPTSAITGEGLPDLVTFITYLCQTNFKHKLKEKEEFECSVLEVKVIEGHGTTIDVILVNGRLNVGDTIVLAGFNGPIVTTIRALLTPQPMREMRVKGDYIHHESIKGSMGIKISAPGLDNAMAGSELYKAENEEEIETFKAQIADDLVDIMDKYVDKTTNGVCVQASTIGSLEALLEFLKTMKIPVTSINIGPVHRKDILKTMKSLQGDHVQKEFATMLAFDVKIMPDAQSFAEENGITIFTANIIYHLFDQFEAHVKKCREERKSEDGAKAVFPCLLEIVKGNVFHVKDPIVMGVNVKAGQLKIGTPLCVPDKGNQRIGKVESIELNGKPLQIAKPSHGSVAVKIVGDSSITVGRHFDETNQIASILNRDSIDALKQYFKEDLTQDDWKLVIQLKKMFGIP